MRTSGSFVRAAWILGLAIGGVAMAQPADERRANTPAPVGAVGLPAGARDVSDLLAPLLEKHKVPALAAVVLEGDRIVMGGVAGLRLATKPEPATLNDLWHLGSDTKAMTATLCALLVDRGVMSWGDTLASRFPDEAPAMHEKMRAATLEQLLHNRGSVPADLRRDGLWAKLWGHTGTTTEGRLLLLRTVAAWEPGAAPGEKFEYSNGGFAIAGLMAERATGRSWEDLIQKEVFAPLGITSAGFGAPGVKDRADQPRGHRPGGKPVEPGPGSDNPASIGPAGTVHMSITDWARFCAAHLRGDGRNPNRKPVLLKPETWDRLQAPWKGEANAYAMGWGTGTRPWAKGARESDTGAILTHAGSNTMWMAVVWLAPERDFGVLVCCNQGEGGAKATDEAVATLIRAYDKKP